MDYKDAIRTNKYRLCDGDERRGRERYCVYVVWAVGCVCVCVCAWAVHLVVYGAIILCR